MAIDSVKWENKIKYLIIDDVVSIYFFILVQFVFFVDFCLFYRVVYSILNWVKFEK